ncbi:hypothetical protein DOTSEDRAFT_72897 [Dothistroma septosporum NZE10]|uniref:Uncharacterized protein n=1 Tax=Dothistroma septosporum (strain NZE10 / CBS 128990) TaxID=675120 RepID=M2YNS9_DOTSN|nr:hypothetical protein DOTSEDRAFT_72897 [Dothistroma septosporum NZE10]
MYERLSSHSILVFGSWRRATYEPGSPYSTCSIAPLKPECTDNTSMQPQHGTCDRRTLPRTALLPSQLEDVAQCVALISDLIMGSTTHQNRIVSTSSNKCVAMWFTAIQVA